MSREFNLWYQENYVDFHNSQYKSAKAAWKSRVPEGYVIVPIEPTEVMVMAAAGSTEYMDTARTIYKAMIEAAQEEG